MKDNIEHELSNYEYNKKFNQILTEREMIFKKFAGECGMPAVEHWLLYTVYMGYINGEEYTQKKCTELWAFPKQTINAATKRLSDSGLITLEVSQKDRRKKVIHLTDWGKIVSKNIVQPLLDCEESSFDALNSNEKKIFINLLNKIYSRLKTQTDTLYEENKVNFKILNEGEKYGI